MSRVPPSRMPQLPPVQHTGRSSAKALERAEEVKADAERTETNKAMDDKAETKHSAKHAHHAHHAHLSKQPAKQPRQPGQHHDAHDAAHAHHMAEAMGWNPDSAAELEDKKAEADDAHAEEEREKQGSGQRVQVTGKASVPAGKAETAAHDRKKDAFQKVGGQAAGTQKKPDTGSSTPLEHKTLAQVKQAVAVNAATAASTLDAVRQAAERALASGKPPDAFALLNMAQPAGVFFKEGGGNGGEATGEDPELAAAVQEMVQALFGVKGVMRVAPGRNQADEPVVLVIVGTGFGEAQLRVVPEKTKQFPTLIALPYDVLPLKKER